MTVQVSSPRAQPGLRSARWDMTFLIGSIVLCGIPYGAYLLLGGAAGDAAGQQGTLAYQARLVINSLVTFLIGGPHMYATFTRTVADSSFRREHRVFLASTLLVPVAVVAMAVFSYQSYVWLLSIFFALASLHALYQVIWLTDAYRSKANPSLSWPSRLIDYGVIFTSLYPIATYRMVQGDFKIGPVSLTYNQIIHGWYWLAALAGLAFAVLLALWLGKTYREYRSGILNLPKTILIAVTVTVMFLTPSFANLDTAFQGINTWHSFQYLALTWYANHVRSTRGGAGTGYLAWTTEARSQALTPSWRARLAAVLRPLDRGSGWTAFYLICLAMLPLSGLIVLGAHTLWPNLHAGQPGADETYNYIGVLSILLMHYVQDGLLFTNARAIVE